MDSSIGHKLLSVKRLLYDRVSVSRQSVPYFWVLHRYKYVLVFVISVVMYVFVELRLLMTLFVSPTFSEKQCLLHCMGYILVEERQMEIFIINL